MKSINTEYRDSFQGITTKMTVGKNNKCLHLLASSIISSKVIPLYNYDVVMLMLGEICFLRYGSHVT